jgi:hypothetical protein
MIGKVFCLLMENLMITLTNQYNCRLSSVSFTDKQPVPALSRHISYPLAADT